MKIVIDWLIEYGPGTVLAYAIYVLIAGCAFGAYLWYRIWHHEHDPRFKTADIGHHGVE